METAPDDQGVFLKCLKCIFGVFACISALVSLDLPPGNQGLCRPRMDGNHSHTSFTYKAKDKRIAAVSAKGVITARRVGSTTITRAVISANVTQIGESAFEGCTGLERVTIPNGVTTIG